MAQVVGFVKRTPEEKAEFEREFAIAMKKNREELRKKYENATPEELEARKKGFDSLAEKMQQQGW